MANVPITIGTGSASIASQTISGVEYQIIKLVGAETGSTSTLGITPDGSAKVSVVGTVTTTFSGSPSISGAVTVVGNPSISGQVGSSVIGTVPTTQTGTRITSVSGTLTLGAITSGASVHGVVSVIGTVSVVGVLNTTLAPSASMVSGVTSTLTTTGAASLLSTAPGAQRNYVTHVMATNAAATATFVQLLDGGNVIYSGYAAASGGGFSSALPTPLKQPTQAAALEVKTTAQASVVVAAVGFTAA